MNILIFTNTFTPHVGGVARSVEAFTEEYRTRGHRVLVVAPEFPDMPQDEVDVVRIPAIQNFNASDFSVVLPIHPALSETIDAFRPDIVHSQHPFLLGMTAVRIARHRGLPLVFTHHTLYEQYTHYVPGDSPALKRFAIELATRYANLADQVFAPSESIRDLLQQRGVVTPIAVVPTGV
ncbi:MAG TPA: glycosyltransferase, partial [Thiobacillus sp.]|nr:glycosyltransferase [Thiobacillus sp.]